jgi:hypothetical protein
VPSSIEFEPNPTSAMDDAATPATTDAASATAAQATDEAHDRLASNIKWCRSLAVIISSSLLGGVVAATGFCACPASEHLEAESTHARSGR